MFVIGRSGSGLVHAFLDGHPEVLHIPHTFKFYDFVAANDDLHDAAAEAWADRLLATPALAFLFDSSRSVIVGGRLGTDMGVTVLVDAVQFRAAFLSAVGTRRLTATEAFVGIVLAYGWAIGQDLNRVRVLFHHVHHGDWLWPEQLIDRSNCQPPPKRPASAVLQADRYLVSVCDPDQALNSIVRFVAQLGLDTAAQIETREQLIRLLAQDWRRAHFLRAGTEIHAVRLEDLRADALRTMRTCAAWLGIDASAPSLTALTYYGFEWFGDIYTSPSSTVKPVTTRRLPPWQDRIYLAELLDGMPSAMGYPAVAVPAGAVWASLVWPSPFLRANGYAAAKGWAERRQAFVSQFTSATTVAA
mgnify:FL=1